MSAITLLIAVIWTCLKSRVGATHLVFSGPFLNMVRTCTSDGWRKMRYSQGFNQISFHFKRSLNRRVF